MKPARGAAAHPPWRLAKPARAPEPAFEPVHEASVGKRYGVFQLGGMQLALHLSALREVVPLSEAIALPCAHPAVPGGVDLRGLLVPMLDLRQLLRRPEAEAEAEAKCRPANVIVMQHAGRLLGLLADEVSGVFDCPAAQRHGIAAAHGEAGLLEASFAHPETGALISVLNPARVAALPEVPMAEAAAEAAPAAAAAGVTEQLLLTRCGSLALALPSTVIHSTVLNPQVQPSVLADGHCLGTVDVAGRQVPAMDLGALCGITREGVRASARWQAFVVAYPQGLLAFLVDGIADVRPFDTAALLPVPAAALPRPGLFRGAVPAAALGSETGPALYLLLDGAALLALPELERLAALNQGGPAPAQASAARASAGGGWPAKVLSYEIGGAQAATPLEQISEILPWEPQQALSFGAGQGASLGLIANRGRTIPAFDLACLAGRAGGLGAGASVLVVEQDGGAVGFAVPRLVGIDAVKWMPQQDLARWTARNTEATEATEAGTPASGMERVLIEDAAGERMCGLLDLRQLARSLLA